LDTLKEYIINFAGLKIGEHSFSYILTDIFFKEFDYSEVTNGNLLVQVDVFKQERMFELDFYIKGTAEVECSRCLDKFPYPIECTNKLIIKLGEAYSELSEEAIIIPENETMFNIAHYLYEFIIISLPIKRIHPNNKEGISTCNKDMLKLLEEVMLSPDIDNEEDEKEIDPRWEILKNFKFN